MGPLVGAVIGAVICVVIHFATKLRPGLYRIRGVPCYGIKLERLGRGWSVASVEFDPKNPTVTHLIPGEFQGAKFGTFLLQSENDVERVIRSMKEGLRAMYQHEEELKGGGNGERVAG